MTKKEWAVFVLLKFIEISVFIFIPWLVGREVGWGDGWFKHWFVGFLLSVLVIVWVIALGVLVHYIVKGNVLLAKKLCQKLKEE